MRRYYRDQLRDEYDQGAAGVKSAGELDAVFCGLDFGDIDPEDDRHD
jgi:hypothetical protein